MSVLVHTCSLRAGSFQYFHDIKKVPSHVFISIDFSDDLRSQHIGNKYSKHYNGLQQVYRIN